MNEEVLSRLRRLGVVKGARQLQPPAMSIEAGTAMNRLTTSDAPPLLEHLLPGGRVVETDDGGCFVIDRVYPVQHRHGPDALADLLVARPDVAARYLPDSRVGLPSANGFDFRHFLFLDTETTGLAGAGTLAFMVGVAFFESRPGASQPEAFVVRQYFLRDHGDELAMLRQLDELVASKAGLVTFNGRSFDVPLLDNRYVMNRLRSRLSDLPHIDLLPPARRLYRARLGSCALSALEQNLLGLRRTEEDAPGWLIPSLYYQYLRTGDARELTRVFYHNEMDMLSMVTLAARIFRQLADSRCDEALDQVSLARWQADLGLRDLAEQSLRASLDADLPLEAYHLALHRLGELLKAAGRRAEAVVVWQQIAVTSGGDVTAHVELAKHYEWHERDIPTAVEWTQRALTLLDRRPPTPNTRLARLELLHRLERLQGKMRQ